MKIATAKVDADHPLCGVWRVEGDDSDDYYRAEYSISVVNDGFHVAALDRSDGEEFEISDVTWNGATLGFCSYVPSTERCGVCQLRYLGDGKTEFLFTFTVREIWSRCIPSSAKDEEAEQAGAGQPATRSGLDSEGGDQS
jgi:hypothetical protein